MAEAMINLQHQATIPSLGIPPHHHHQVNPTAGDAQHGNAHAHGLAHPASTNNLTSPTASGTIMPVHHMRHSPTHHSANHVQPQHPPQPQQQQQPPVQVQQQQQSQPQSQPQPQPMHNTNNVRHSHPAMKTSSIRIHNPTAHPPPSAMNISSSSTGTGTANNSSNSNNNMKRRNSKVMFDLSHVSSGSGGHGHGHGHGHTQTSPSQQQHAQPSPSQVYSNSHGHGHGHNNHGQKQQQHESSKRHKPSAQATAQHVIMGIQQGITGQDRREAIHNACAAFDHGVEIAHDDEIQVGADAVLFKHVTFLLYKRSLVRDQRRKHHQEQQKQKQQKQEMLNTPMESHRDGIFNINKGMQRSSGSSHLDTQGNSGDGRSGDVDPKNAHSVTAEKKQEEEKEDIRDWNGEDIRDAITRSRSQSADSEASSTNFKNPQNSNACNTPPSSSSSSSQPQEHHLSSSFHDEEEDSLMEEVCTALSGLEMVLRCSAECISTSFDRIGQELLYILITFMEEELDRRQQSQQQVLVHVQHDEDVHTTTGAVKEGQDENGTKEGGQNANVNSATDDNHTHSAVEKGAYANHKNKSVEPSPSPISSPRISPTTTATNTTSYTNFSSSSRSTGDAIFKTATKIIGHFARVGSLTNTLADVPGLLTTLRRVVAANGDVISSIHRTVPIEAKLNSLWVIANLACCAENMQKMAEHPQLLDTVVHVASHPNDYDESQCENVTEYLQILRSRSIAVRAILNLSWAHGNKIPFSEHPSLVDALLRAASQRHSSWTGHGRGVSGYLLQTRRHAAGALRNLAAAPRRYKRRLCRFRDSCTFLETLADVATHDNDEVVREKIHATLFNLVSADTAKLFVEKQSVLDVIVRAATSMVDEDDNGMTDGGAGESKSTCAATTSTQAMAIQTLQSLEKAIPEDEEDYEVLRPVLSRFDSQVTMFKSISRPGLSTCTGGQAAV